MNLKTISLKLFFILFTAGLFLSLTSISKAATFTVDATGDQADLSTDGLCATSLGTCTLRAAITEANAATGPHSINFNIPTSDSGYVDFDGGGGDGANGDDYWTIVPGAVLPSITAAGVTIDGATQTTNQGDKNTSGPEIEINGNTAGEVWGLTFAVTSTNSAVNSIVINRFGGGFGNILISGAGFILTRSYVGPNVKGLASFGGSDAFYGIYFDLVSGTVGNSTADGNVISGNIFGITAGCPLATGQTAYINVAGNIVGLGADGSTTMGAQQRGIRFANDCYAIVGGDTSAERNIFGGNTAFHVNMTLGDGANTGAEIYNNFVGTDITGTLNRGSGGKGVNFSSVAAECGYGFCTYGGGIPVQVGAEGKGNLIRYASLGVDEGQSGPRNINIEYNTISDIPSRAVDIWTNTGGDDGLTINVKHNFFGQSASDPYFGLATGQNAFTVVRIVPSNSPNGHIVNVSNNEIRKSGNYGIRLNLLNNNSEATIDSNIIDQANVEAIGTYATLKSAVITNNQITNIGAGAGISIFANTTNGTYITGNTVTGGATQGILIGDTIGKLKAEDNIVNNNTSIEIDNFTTLGSIEANDAGDADSGINNLQNWPEIQTVEYIGAGQYRVSGRLDGNTSESPFEIEVCEADNDSSGHGGCVESLDIATTASTPDSTSGASNYFNWTTDVQTQYSEKQDGIIFTTTATSSVDATSEFGTNFTCVDNTVCPDLEFPVSLVSPIDGQSITDSTPLLNWNSSALDDLTNPEVDHYDVILDNSVIATVDDAVTEYQTTTGLTNGVHTWKVIAYRANNVVTGESEEESFSVEISSAAPQEITYDFNLLDPIGGKIIEDKTPKFDWEDISEESNLDFYDFYINNKFIKNTGKSSEYQIQDTEALDDGLYNWQVFAYKFVNGEAVEIYRSSIESFEIKTVTPEIPPVVNPPQTGGKDPEAPKPVKPSTPGFINNVKDFKIESLTPAAGIVAASATVAISTAFLTAGKDILEKLGFVIGGILPKKKKYWGIVFDAIKSQGIPFGVIRIYDGNKKIINTTVTDLDGRYGIPVSDPGIYTIEVKAQGFKPYTKLITINDRDLNEIIIDIPLERSGSQLDPIRSFIFYYMSEILLIIRTLILVLMFGGFVYSLYVFTLHPILLNLLVLILYIGLFFLNIYQEYKHRRNIEGRVIDFDTRTGVPNTTVILYNSRGEQEDVRLTNSKGIAKLRAKSGTYQVQALRSGYYMSDLEIGKSSIELKVDERGYLTKAIFMRKNY